MSHDMSPTIKNVDEQAPTHGPQDDADRAPTESEPDAIIQISDLIADIPDFDPSTLAPTNPFVKFLRRRLDTTGGEREAEKARQLLLTGSVQLIKAAQDLKLPTLRTDTDNSGVTRFSLFLARDGYQKLAALGIPQEYCAVTLDVESGQPVGATHWICEVDYHGGPFVHKASASQGDRTLDCNGKPGTTGIAKGFLKASWEWLETAADTQ